MAEYRKRIGNDTWHWCTNCSNWPTGRPGIDYTAHQGKPTNGELDNECRAKQANDQCRTIG
jgi:hypothetical protein